MVNDKGTKFLNLKALFKHFYKQKVVLKCDNYLMIYAHALPINVLTRKISPQNLRANMNEKIHCIFTAYEVRSANFSTLKAIFKLFNDQKVPF